MAEMNFIKHAMNLLAIEMNADHEPGSYYHGWQSNIAMAIHDGFNSTPVNIGTDEEPEWVGEPLDPTNIDDCNEIAKRFLKLAFPPKDD